jgi:hypothetical protein
MKKFIIPDWAKESLAEGNRYTFAELFAQKFPKEFKKNKFNIHNYSSWIDFNKDDNSFTVWTNTGKYFFNTNLECTGEKEY